MKLRNKLIPLATIFATGAVVAPVTLTSCSAGGMVDLTNGNYAPTIKKAVTEGYKATESLAMEKWMAEVNENPEVLIQDKLWSEGILIKGFADLASINAASIKAQVKNVSVKYMTVKIDDVEQKVPTVSMTYTVTLEANWYVEGSETVYLYDATEGWYKAPATPENVAALAAYYGAPMYFPIQKYYHDYGIPGNVYCSKVYETTWENIPVQFIDMDSSSSYIPQINTEWFIAPYVDMIPYLEAAKQDWKYSVKYVNEDVFKFNKDGAETSKTYESTMDRTFTVYDKLISGPTIGAYYTRGDLVLGSEAFGSYYLSDITKDE